MEVLFDECELNKKVPTDDLLRFNVLSSQFEDHNKREDLVLYKHKEK